MSVLANASSDAIENAILNIARPIFAAAIWKWYGEHENDTLLRKWVFTIRVRDVRFLVETIAGPDPTNNPDGASDAASQIR